MSNDNKDKDEKDLDDKKWSELAKCEKFDLESQNNKLIEYKKSIANQYNFKLYEWFFLLNAGGLIGTITLITIKTKDPNYIILCVLMAASFIFGIMFIIWANLTERERFRCESERIKSVFENDLIQDKVSRRYFLKSINLDQNKVSTTKIIETLSIIFFIIGITIGAVYLAVKSDDMCENACTYCSKENYFPQRHFP